MKMPEDDIILEEGDSRETELDIIDNQLMVINTMLEMDQVPYDDFPVDKMKIIIRAMKVIYQTQKKLL